MTDRSAGLRVLLVSDVGEREQLLRESLLLALPSVCIDMISASELATYPLPDAARAVVDVSSATAAGVDTIRALRARGFEGRMVVVRGEAAQPALDDAATMYSGRPCLRRADVVKNPAALASALLAGEDSGAPEMAELTRMRRVLAAGERALKLQHAINNPLAGLLAETQLLQLEALTGEQREAVTRILELCRRVIALVRQLDAGPDSKDG